MRKGKKRVRWLTRTSTFRRGKRAKGKSETYTTLVKKMGVSEIYSKIFSKMVLDRKPGYAML